MNETLILNSQDFKKQQTQPPEISAELCEVKQGVPLGGVL